jgi:hypothetical protein
MKKAYLSMPISGYDIEERIDHAKEVKQSLLNFYDDVVTPFDACPYDPNKTYGECMKDCLAELIKCDIIIMDRDWIQSNGCRIELEVARGCELEKQFI